MNEQILTGKAIRCFNVWTQDKNIKFNPYEWSLDLAESMLYAIIQEWFDTIDIVTNTEFTAEGWMGICDFKYVPNIDGSFFFISRKEALKAAIIKANKLYNSNHES